MKPLFTDEELNLAKSKDLLPIECLVCGKTFYKTKHYIKSRILNLNSQTTGDACSLKCAFIKQKKNKVISKICPKCGCNFETISGKGEKKFCSSFCSHSRKHTEKTKKKQSESAKNSKKVQKNCLINLSKSRIYNKRITEEEKILKICPICKKEFKLYPSESKRIFCSKNCCNKDVNFEYKKKTHGGYREGSGRSKSGWYKGYYCGSSYELAWIIYNIDHEIKFKRNYEGFNYIFEGEEHKYYPDFIRGDAYYEIKGFKRKNDDTKFKYFPHELKVLLKKDLGDIFAYVRGTYGNNFIELYEGNPYKQNKNKCPICGKPAKYIYCSRKCSGIAVSKLKSNALETRTPDSTLKVLRDNRFTNAS